MTAVIARTSRTGSALDTPVLDRNDEVVDYHAVAPLFLRMAAADQDEIARKRLRRQIITICMPLAEHIALRFRNRGEPQGDLQQVAYVALVRVVDRYDAARGTDFLAFAVPSIMGEVRRYFRDCAWSVHVPRGVKELHLWLRPTVDSLTQRLGRAPTVREISESTGLSRDRITSALFAGNGYASRPLDTVAVERDGQLPTLHTHGIDEPGFEYITEFLTIQPLLAMLPPGESEILYLRFFEDLTQSQIARKVGKSQMHVSRVLARTLTRLRDQALPECE